MKISLTLLFAFILNFAFAQPINVPINNAVHQQFERNLSDSLFPAFASVRPMQQQWLVPGGYVLQRDTTRKLNRWMNGHLIRYADDQFSVWIDPILTGTIGRSSNQRVNTFQSSRGVQMGMLIGKSIGIGAAFTENQARFPGFVQDYIHANRNVIPGMGLGRVFKENAWDYAFSDAYLRYAPGKVFSATLGYGQNFLGDGYRSMFLSDAAFNYPFLQINLNLKRFHYTAIYSQQENLLTNTAGAFPRKWSTMHYINVKLGKRWQVGVFDGVIWQAEDSASKRGFELAYLNPVPFLRPIEFARGSPDNMVMGLHAKYKAADRTFLYTQILLDDFNFQASRAGGQQHLNNKYGIQIGAKRFDEVGETKLFSRLEYNHARPYTYGHRIPAQSYTHYHQPLAHLLQANFHEIIIHTSATRNRWYGDILLQLARVGREDPLTPYNDGNDLYGGEADVPGLGTKTLQGIQTKQFTGQAVAGYVLNTKWNFAVQGSMLYRNVAAGLPQNAGSLWINVGFVTRLRNHYWDF